MRLAVLHRRASMPCPLRVQLLNGFGLGWSRCSLLHQTRLSAVVGIALHAHEYAEADLSVCRVSAYECKCMEIVVQLRSAAPQNRDTLPHRRASVVAVAEELGVQLQPIAFDPASRGDQQAFRVEVQSQEEAATVLDRLRECAEVEAAYLKPDDELP